MQSYTKLGSEEAGREVVVPESARRLVSDSEGYVLFSVVILKKFERAVQTACRENRYAMRLFNLEEMKESGATEMEERELAKFEVEERKLKVWRSGCVERSPTCCNGADRITRSWQASGCT